jgi:hypothetical protein
VPLAHKRVASGGSVPELEDEAGPTGHERGAPQLPAGLQEGMDLRLQGIGGEGHGVHPVILCEELHAVPRAGLDQRRHRMLRGSPTSQGHAVEAGPLGKSESPGFLHLRIRLAVADEATPRKTEEYEHGGEREEASPR